MAVEHPAAVTIAAAATCAAQLQGGIFVRFLSIAVVTAAVLLTGCASQQKVAKVNPSTGLLVTEVGQIGSANTIQAKQISLAKFNGIALVTNGGDYGVSQLKETKLFKDVYSYNDMQKLIVANGLQDQVTSIGEPVGLTRLAKAYKPFLWVLFKGTRKDNRPYLQLIATDPTTLEEVFVAEVKLDYAWAGVNDQNTSYPLFNEFITWVRKNP